MIQRFLICGDSWGVGAYRYEGNGIYPIPNTGIDYYLREQKHFVKNIALGQASNYVQLKELSKALEVDSNYDYIIWFQTEPNRDIVDTVVGNVLESVIQYPSFDIKDYSKCMSYIKDRNYQYAQYIYDKFKVPFIVIGGLSKIDDSIENYNFASYVIKSWLADITHHEYDLAENMHQNIMLKVLDSCHNVDKAYMVRELDKMKFIEELLETHPNFSNGVHPNTQQYANLTNQILLELGLLYQESLGTSELY